MEEMEFKVQWCQTCGGEMIICPKCGNNCCNGGYGKMDKNGKALPWNAYGDAFHCDVCPLAYQYQGLYEKLQEQCTCPQECECKWGVPKDSEGLDSWFEQLLEHNDNCPIHNKLDPNPDCPVHGEQSERQFKQYFDSVTANRYWDDVDIYPYKIRYNYIPTKIRKTKDVRY